LVTTNRDGQVEGVKYDRIGVVAVNAINEQQAQINEQQTTIDRLKKQISEQDELLRKQRLELDAIKKALCTASPSLDLCGLPR
jgi:uncharacterized coiled-coil protein SlyX